MNKQSLYLLLATAFIISPLLASDGGATDGGKKKGLLISRGDILKEPKKLLDVFEQTCMRPQHVSIFMPGLRRVHPDAQKDIIEHVRREGEYLEYAKDIIAQPNPPLNMIENAYSALRLLVELTDWELGLRKSDPELLRRKKESHFAMMKQLAEKPCLDEVIRAAEHDGANDSDVDEGVRAYDVRIDYVMKAQTFNRMQDLTLHSKYDPKPDILITIFFLLNISFCSFLLLHG